MRTEMRQFFLLIAILAGALNCSFAGSSNNSCVYSIGGNGQSYYLNKSSACASVVSYRFAANSSNNRIFCGPGSPSIAGVNFSDYTYNNTIANCTFANATITSLRKAENNLISPYGRYLTSFSDNSSDIALGYYFTFVSRDVHGIPYYAGFITIVPRSLENMDPRDVRSQQITADKLRSVAAANDYTLPRFGYYALVNSTTGILAFPLETELIYRNRSVSYNPYWIACPYWGLDVLTFRTFTINSNLNYTPILVYPQMKENVLLPDNATVYWNFTVIRYNNATNITAHIFSGWQVDPDNKIVDVVHNVTNGTISYKLGMQSPGIYEYIAVLKSPEAQEQDNSTTETYSIGLSYCLDGSIVNQSGYYTMPYNSITKLNVFFRTNSLCDFPLKISSKDVMINCKGGIINSTKTSILVTDSNGITIENCKVYGNAFNISDSFNVIVKNTSIIANNATNIIGNFRNSKFIYFINDSIIGYSYQNVNSTYLINTSYYENATYQIMVSINQNTTKETHSTVKPSYFSFGIGQIAILLAVAVSFYFVVNRFKYKPRLMNSR